MRSRERHQAASGVMVYIQGHSFDEFIEGACITICNNKKVTDQAGP